jgi:putative ABC transport system ATP-binding protein
MNNVSNSNLVVAKDLCKQVPALDGTATGQIDILKSLNLEIKSGESVAILGASGSGKSTLLGLLAGLDAPSSGEVWLANARLADLNEDGRAQLRGRYVGFVFQSFQLLPNLTALENVMLPMELGFQNGAKEKALELLERVGLKERVQHYPKQLSGGEQQRVAIARAFVTQPKVLFADEPTGNLDRNTGERIIDLLMEINRETGQTLVMVTHDEQLAKRCQRRLVLVDGAIAEQVS